MTVEEVADRAALAVMADGLFEASGFFLRGSREALNVASERLRLASEAFASLGQGSVFALTRSIQARARSNGSPLDLDAPERRRPG